MDSIAEPGYCGVCDVDSFELLDPTDKKSDGLDNTEPVKDRTEVASELIESRGLAAGLMNLSVLLDRLQFKIILPLGYTR